MTTTTPPTFATSTANRIDRLAEQVRRLRTRASSGGLDRWLLIGGGILMPLGVVFILLGWAGASRTPLPFEQNDYLISGGLLGLSLVISGGFTYFAYWQTVRIRESRAQATELTTAIARLEALLSGGASAGGTAAAAPATKRTLVATASGSIFHRPDCAAVAGRTDLIKVDPAKTKLPAVPDLHAARRSLSFPTDVLPAEFTDLARAVNNWQRWGSDDERGTLNLIEPATVRAAASLVRDGRRISLALPMSEDGPQLGFVPGRTNPIRTTIARQELMGGDEAGVRFNDDAVSMGVQAATHWDALAHVSYDGRMYNGFSPDVVDETGATRLGADSFGPIVSRGVLLDVARAAGVDRLDGGHALTASDLDAAEELAKVTVGPGDIVLIRTGQMQHLHAGDKMAYCISTAGPSLQSARWFHDRDIAAVATDNLSFEVFPGEIDGLFLPVHMIHIVEMGLVQGQNFDLDMLAQDCADDGRYGFLLVATPEPIVHAAGAPTTPVAIK